MNTIFTLTKKEFRDFFGSPIAYVFITVFLLLSFSIYFSGVFLIGETSLRIFFGWLPVLFVVFLPAVTMAKWSEEKKTGTYEILMTLPASDWQVILGKLFACILFLFVVLLLTLPLVFVMKSLGDLDMGKVMGGYLGIFLLGSSYLALGLFISSLTKNQIIAFLITVATLFLFYLIAEPIVTSYLPGSVIPTVQFLSFNRHFLSMSRGVVDSRDVIYFLSTAGFFVYLNMVSLQRRKV